MTVAYRYSVTCFDPAASGRPQDFSFGTSSAAVFFISLCFLALQLCCYVVLWFEAPETRFNLKANSGEVHWAR